MIPTVEQCEKQINAAASEYRKEGYDVIVKPKDSQLPDFLKNFQPDLLATNHDEKIVIEVKTRKNLLSSHQVEELAKAVEKHPDWRFDLIVTNPKGEMLLSEKAQLPDKHKLLDKLSFASRMIDTNVDVAMVLAWSAAEGFLRLIGQREGFDLENRASSYVLRKLYSMGLLEGHTFSLLSKSLKLRDAFISGFSIPPFDADSVKQLIANIKQNVQNEVI